MLSIIETFQVKDKPVLASKIPNEVIFDTKNNYVQTKIATNDISCSKIDNKMMMVKQILVFYF